MIRSLLLISFVFIVINSFSQTEKGTILLGGQVQYKYTMDYTNSNSYYRANRSETLSILPSIGYFVKENLTVGTALGYIYSKGNGYNEYSKQHTFVAAPYGRCYKSLWTEQFKLMGQISVSVGVNDRGRGHYERVLWSYGASASPGIAYFPAKKLGIELMFNGVSFSRSKGYREINIGDNFFTPAVGIDFYL